VEIRSIINKIQADGYIFRGDALVYTNYSVAGLEEDDFWEIIDYLDANQIRYNRDKRSMLGLWIIELD